jgi:hypothetical protein
MLRFSRGERKNAKGKGALRTLYRAYHHVTIGTQATPLHQANTPADGILCYRRLFERA